MDWGLNHKVTYILAIFYKFDINTSQVRQSFKLWSSKRLMDLYESDEVFHSATVGRYLEYDTCFYLCSYRATSRPKGHQTEDPWSFSTLSRHHKPQHLD